MTKQKTAGFGSLFILEIGAWLLVIIFILMLGYWSLSYIYCDKLLHIDRHRGFDLNGYIFYRMNEFDSISVQ